MQYSCIEEQRKGNSYEAVERRDMVKMNYVVLLYRGTDDGKQL